MRNVTSKGSELTRLEPGEYGTVSGLVDSKYPNLAFVYGVLEGNIPGKVWARHEQGEIKAALVETNSSFCFSLGSVTQSLFTEFQSLVEMKSSVKLVHPSMCVAVGNEANRRGFSEAERFHFTLEGTGNIPSSVCDLPDGFTVKRIDENLFEMLNWREMVLQIFGTAKNYLQNGFGFCLLHGDSVVAEAHGVVGGSFVELGIYTHPAYRRQGLPLIVMAETARLGATRGLTTVVSCDKETTATVSVSLRLGMRWDFAYKVARRTAI
ncbi:GNAT family N-acetyltransferase [Streptomyces sp. NPDC058664]|uniref:GNAT family N-acetyltransferase n=1 Tax=unclassified Streptomyces TaxID=2593676 RepID=UPI003669DCC2